MQSFICNNSACYNYRVTSQDCDEVVIDDFTVLRKPKNKPKLVISEANNMHHETVPDENAPSASETYQGYESKADYWKARYNSLMEEMGNDMVAPSSVTAPNVSGYGWGGNFGANLVGVNPGDAALILSNQLASLHLSNQGIMSYQGANALYMSMCMSQNSKENALATKDVEIKLERLRADINDAKKDDQIIGLLTMILAKLPTPA